MYILLNYHFIFSGSSVKFLRKATPTLECTFYSIDNKTNKLILSREDLVDAGIADLLVEVGRMSEEHRDIFMEKYEAEDAAD